MKKLLCSLVLLAAACSSPSPGKKALDCDAEPMTVPNGYGLLYDVTYTDNVTGATGEDLGIAFDCYLELMADGKSGNYCGFDMTVTEDGYLFDTRFYDDGFEQHQASGFGNEEGVNITYLLVMPLLNVDFTYEFSITHTTEF